MKKKPSVKVALPQRGAIRAQPTNEKGDVLPWPVPVCNTCGQAVPGLPIGIQEFFEPYCSQRCLPTPAELPRRVA